MTDLRRVASATMYPRDLVQNERVEYETLYRTAVARELLNDREG